MASFDEVQFPVDISQGATSRRNRLVDVVPMRSGFEQRNSVWSNSRCSFEVGLGLRDLDDVYTVIHFWEARQGQLRGFRYKDWADFRSGTPTDIPTSLDQSLVAIDATHFQIVKVYSKASNPWTRTITKPVIGSLLIQDGTGVLAESTDYAADYTTGIVTFGVAPTGAPTAGFEFDVPVRFEDATLEINIALFNVGSIPTINLAEIRLPAVSVAATAPASFDEVQFPVNISREALSTPKRTTEVIVLRSGFEQRNPIWADSKRNFEVGLGLRNLDDIYSLLEFWEARRGQARGFRFKDWADYKSCAPGSVITDMDQAMLEIDPSHYQLVKVYSAASNPWTRTIAKPVVGSLIVRDDYSRLIEGVNYTMDYTTGVGSFVGYSGECADYSTLYGIPTAGFEFDTPIRFSENSIEIGIGQVTAGLVPDIKLTEVRSPAPTVLAGPPTCPPEDWQAGGLARPSRMPSFCNQLSPFVTRWDVGSDLYIGLPLLNGAYSEDACVDWGDGVVQSLNPSTASHHFPTSGSYTISIASTQLGWSLEYGNPYSLSHFREVVAWGDVTFSSLSGGFYQVRWAFGMDSTFQHPATDLSRLFYHCHAFNQSLNGWDTGSVTNMSAMFYHAQVFDQDIGGWDTSAVTNMSYMFGYTYAFDQDIGGWDTSAVTDMSYMFDTAKVFNQSLNGWDTSAVTNMSLMFYKAPVFNQSLNGWDTSAVTNMLGMFDSCAAFNQDIGGWDTSAVTNMAGMFVFAYAFDQNIGGWNVTSITSAGNMFYGTQISTGNYNALLIGWAAQTVNSNVPFHGGSSKYSASAASARASLVSRGWTITDGGPE